MKWLRYAFYKAAFKYVEINSIYEKIVKGNKTGPSFHRRQLEALLNKVNITNPFFKGKFSNFLEKVKGVSDEEFLEEYSKLPHYTKKDYLNASTRIIDGQKTIKRTLDHSYGFAGLLQHLKVGDFSFDLATGGSSKQPLTIHMDKYHTFRMAFSFFRCWYEMGWRPGDKVMIFYPNKIYDLEGIAQYNYLCNLHGFKFILFDNLDMDTTKKFVNELNSFRPDLLIIFPSPLNILSHNILKNDIKIEYQPPMINTSGETFFQCQRDNIEQVFTKSKVQDSYGSVELGEIAHETSPGLLKVFEDFAYVETIPTENGKNEVLVTIHDHDHFPFIKYKMGDLMECKETSNGKFVYRINGKDTNKIKIPNGYLYPRELDDFIDSMNNRPDWPRYMPKPIVDVKLIKYGDDKLKVKLILSHTAWTLSQANTIVLDVKENFKRIFGVDIAVEVVDKMEHDYRLKYRVIEDKNEELEWAGGIIGQKEKMKGIDNEK